MKSQCLWICQVCTPCYKQRLSASLWPLTLHLDVDGVRHDLFVVYFRLTDIGPIVWTLHAGYASEETQEGIHSEHPLSPYYRHRTFFSLFVLCCDGLSYVLMWLGHGAQILGRTPL